MFFYLYRVAALIVSITLLKCVVGLDVFIDTRVFLAAISVAGVISVVEFGLGDLILRGVSDQVIPPNVMNEINKIVCYAVLMSIVCCGFVVYYYHQYYSLERTFFVFLIMLSGLANMIAGIFLKVCIKVKELSSRLSVAAFALMGIALISYLSDFNGREKLLLIVASQIFIAFYFYSSMSRLEENSCVPSKRLIKKGRSGYAVENIINPVLISAVGFYVAGMENSSDVEEYSVILRIVNVVAMFGMLELMMIWRKSNTKDVVKVVGFYFLGMVLSVILIYLVSPLWYPAFVDGDVGKVSLSFIPLLLMLLWRAAADGCSQISKYQGKPSTAIANSIVSMLLILFVYALSSIFGDESKLLMAYFFIAFFLSVVIICMVLFGHWRLKHHH